MLFGSYRTTCLTWLALLIGQAIEAHAAHPLRFELVMEPGFSITDSQRWVQFLAKLDQTSIRIRQSQPSDREMITNRGTDDRPVYHVVGVLTNRNRLRLAGGEFSLGDREGMAAWIKKVESEGVAGPTLKTTVFGLTAETKRGQDSFFGRPRGRRVRSKPRRIALLRAQMSEPNGEPRRMHVRMAFTSASDCGSLTHVRHCRGNRGSAGTVNQRRAAESVWLRAHAELQRHFSACFTSLARSGFRST